MNWLFDIFAGIFQWPMRWFYELTGHNYLLALLLFTLLVKVIFVPLAVKQQKTQIKGAMLRPKIALIEKKYKGKTDRDSLQQKQTEIMELQQKEGYSPFSGCLPMLLQLPVLLGIYQVVRKPFTYMLGIANEVVVKLNNFVAGTSESIFDQIDQLGLIKGVAQKIEAGVLDLTTFTEGALTELPNMNVFGSVNLSDTPNIGSLWDSTVTVSPWLLLIPVFSFLFPYLSMKVSRMFNAPVQTAAQTPETEMSNKIMELTMPLMSVFIAFSVPAAVGVYWMFNSIFSIIQTIILAKLMPLPTFTEEQLREYEKEVKASRSRSSQGPRRAVRSRHHIDDDDYESLPEAPSAQKSGKSGKNGGIQAAPQKSESDKKKDN